MNRAIALLLAVVFIAGFAVLTGETISKEGLTPAGLIALFVLLLLAVGILGALRHPPE